MKDQLIICFFEEKKKDNIYNELSKISYNNIFLLKEIIKFHNILKNLRYFLIIEVKDLEKFKSNNEFLYVCYKNHFYLKNDFKLLKLSFSLNLIKDRKYFYLLYLLKYNFNYVLIKFLILLKKKWLL